MERSPPRPEGLGFAADARLSEHEDEKLQEGFVGTGLYYNFRAGAQANGAIINMRPGDFKPLVRLTYRLCRFALRREPAIE